MLDLLQASETVSGYTIRAWTGIATDEGVGLISMVEVDDARGVPVCRFEEFVADSVRRSDPSWPREQDAAAKALQDQALERARNAVLSNTCAPTATATATTFRLRQPVLTRNAPQLGSRTENASFDRLRTNGRLERRADWRSRLRFGWLEAFSL